MRAKYYRILSLLIASVWLVNGLVKIFNLVPRHEMIVARILGNDYAHVLTLTIGIAEIAMAIWIISGIKTRLNVITQIAVIAAMNILEFIVAPDLLLWGKLTHIAH